MTGPGSMWLWRAHCDLTCKGSTTDQWVGRGKTHHPSRLLPVHLATLLREREDRTRARRRRRRDSPVFRRPGASGRAPRPGHRIQPSGAQPVASPGSPRGWTDSRRQPPRSPRTPAQGGRSSWRSPSHPRSLRCPSPRTSRSRFSHEDRDLLVLDKPAGLVVHPAAGHARGHARERAAPHVPGLSGIGGVLRPGIVHRLDKDTSGCIVVAKNDARSPRARRARSRLGASKDLPRARARPAARRRRTSRRPRPPPARQEALHRAGEAGKPAVTTRRVRRRLHGAAFLEVGLETGRTHQIRVHLSELGHPLLGDTLYGGTRRGTRE